MDKWFYPNGALYALRSREKREYFYPDGKIKTIEPYVEGKLEGEVLLYWPKGQLKRKCPFVKGVRHGLDQMWNEEGILIDEGAYEKGKPMGTHRRFNKEGNRLEEMTYLDAIRFNLLQWDEKGILRVEAIWFDTIYREKVWDSSQNKWLEKEGRWDGKKLVYV